MEQEKEISVVATFSREEVLSAIVERMTYRLSEKMDKIVLSAVEKEVEKSAREGIQARISDQLDQILREGFQQTNNWGTKAGEIKTLRQMMIDYLTLPRGDSYSHKGPYIDQLFRKCVDDAMGKELKKELDAAVIRLRESVDKTIQARLQETLKKALGLR